MTALAAKTHMNEPWTQAELDDFEFEFDNVLDELMHAYGCVEDVSLLPIYAEGTPLEREFYECLAGARDELEDALRLIERCRERL
jgi:hypothetical protein